jgi:uncharacterized protein (DUF697 family)
LAQAEVKAAAVLLSLASLPPQPFATKAHTIPSSCGQVVKLVQLFGIEAVLAEARRRGVSEQTIAGFRRRCNL